MTKDLAVKTMGWNEMSSLVYQVLGLRSGLLYTSTKGRPAGGQHHSANFCPKSTTFYYWF